MPQTPPPSTPTPSELDVRFVTGSVAPRFDEVTDVLTCIEAVITEQGTNGGLPIVDFRCRDQEGRLHIFMLTGRVVQAVGKAIEGVNMRIHGKPNP